MGGISKPPSGVFWGVVFWQENFITKLPWSKACAVYVSQTGLRNDQIWFNLICILNWKSKHWLVMDQNCSIYCLKLSQKRFGVLAPLAHRLSACSGGGCIWEGAIGGICWSVDVDTPSVSFLVLDIYPVSSKTTMHKKRLNMDIAMKQWLLKNLTCSTPKNLAGCSWQTFHRTKKRCCTHEARCTIQSLHCCQPVFELNWFAFGDIFDALNWSPWWAIHIKKRISQTFQL